MSVKLNWNLKSHSFSTVKFINFLISLYGESGHGQTLATLHNFRKYAMMRGPFFLSDFYFKI